MPKFRAGLPQAASCTVGRCAWCGDKIKRGTIYRELAPADGAAEALVRDLGAPLLVEALCLLAFRSGEDLRHPMGEVSGV